MGRRSSIDDLPLPLRDAVNDAVRDGLTIDAIVEMLAAEGEERSRSAVGRYAKSYRELAAYQRDISSVAKSFASDFGDKDNAQQKLLIQIFTSLLTRYLMPLATGEEVDAKPMDMHFISSAIHKITSSAKIDTDRELKIREDERKKARADAAKAAEQAARGAGATPETIAAIKRELLGLD